MGIIEKYKVKELHIPTADGIVAYTPDTLPDDEQLCSGNKDPDGVCSGWLIQHLIPCSSGNAGEGRSLRHGNSRRRLLGNGMHHMEGEILVVDIPMTKDGNLLYQL